MMTGIELQIERIKILNMYEFGDSEIGSMENLILTGYL